MTCVLVSAERSARVHILISTGYTGVPDVTDPSSRGWTDLTSLYHEDSIPLTYQVFFPVETRARFVALYYDTVDTYMHFYEVEISEYEP